MDGDTTIAVITFFIGGAFGIARAIERERKNEPIEEVETPDELPFPYEEPLTAAELKAMDRWFNDD